MRLSLSLKFGIVSSLLVVLVAGALTYVLVFHFGQRTRERDLVNNDRALAEVLAGFRDV